MTPRIRRLLFCAVSALSLSCGNKTTDNDCSGDKCDVALADWVVDLRKTGTYGFHSSYFWGLSLEELDLGAVAEQIDGNQLDAAATQAFSSFGAEAATFKVVWDQVQSVARGWPTVIFPDVATANARLDELNAALPNIAEVLAPMGVQKEEQMAYQVILIDQQGRALAVPGQLKIIPMLQNTSPNEQTHIMAALDDGDILSYVHPSDSSMSGLLERRASHVAMHYEEGNAVHHIDNPNSYGPPYNHAPNRDMPFHAFRYQPENMDAATAALHRKAARNWAFVTNDLSPFADFFDLRLQKFGDLDKFSSAAIQNQQMPELYCSGLAYTNLNLGLNKPQNELGLGTAYQTFAATEYYFSDLEGFYTGSELAAPASLEPVGKLVFEPYTGIDMLNVWLGNAFRGLPKGLHDQFIPEFLKSEQLQQQLGFSLQQLKWSDAEAGDQFSNPEWVAVANTFNVNAWAIAYGMELQGKTGADLSDAGLKVIVDAAGTEKLLSEVIDAKDLATQSPLEIMAQFYEQTVENRFVPPRIWIDQAQRTSNNIKATLPHTIQYLGTVINCELLSAADGSNLDPCEGGGQGAKEYAEGAADTHTYNHYAVLNNGERTHRRIDASAGPEMFGPGTVATVRMTGVVEDTAFALHVPQHWQGTSHLEDTVTQFDQYCNDQWENGESCAPSQGIYLDPNQLAQGTVHNETLTFPLIGEAHSPCEIVDEETLMCDVIDLSSREVTRKEVSRRSHGEGFSGHFTATMIDLGNNTATSDCAIRDELDADNPGRDSGCMPEAGSAHYDVFHIKVSNSEGEFDDEEEFDENSEITATCERDYRDCLANIDDYTWEGGEICLEASDSICDWSYAQDDKGYRPVPSCFPEVNGERPQRGACLQESDCADLGGATHTGLCPGPNNVKCCTSPPADG